MPRPSRSVTMPSACGHLDERGAVVAEQALLLVARERAVADRRPGGGVGDVAILDGVAREVVPEVALAGADEAVDRHDVEVAVGVVVEELAAPAPAAVVGAGLERDVGQGQPAVGADAVVVPEDVALLEVLGGGDVGDVDVEPAVVVEVAEVDVHPLPGVEAGGALGGVLEGAIAAVQVEAIGTEVVGAEEVGVAVVVDVARAHRQGPTRVLDADFARLLDEGAVGLLVVEEVEPGVLGALEVVVHDARRLEVPEVDLAEVVADVDVEPAVEVEVEEDRRGAVGPVGARRAVALLEHALGDLGEGAVAVVAVERVGAPAHQVEVGPAVVVDVAPHRVHAGSPLVVARRQAGRLADLGEGAVAVVAVEAVRRPLLRIGHEQVDPAVAVVVGRGHRGADAADPRHDVVELGVEDRFDVDIVEPGIARDLAERGAVGRARRGVGRGRGIAAATGERRGEGDGRGRDRSRRPAGRMTSAEGVAGIGSHPVPP